MRVAALFTRRDSVYRGFEEVECFDATRDARTFNLDCPVIAHPPCRAWGRLRKVAKPRRDERDLAWYALHAVRHCGGVLEHPEVSRLWIEAGIKPGVIDESGGLLTIVDQAWWGHPARKRTGIYAVGCRLRPALTLGNATRTVKSQHSGDREKTPFELARALLRTVRCIDETYQ